MNQASLPLILEPAELEKHLGAENLLIVDLSRPEIHAQVHVPGAVHLDYARIVVARPPVMGELPNDKQLSDVFGSIGMTPESHVVAYDDEGGGRAARLLWTLDAINHPCYSLLNGGLQAWINEQHPVNAKPARRPRSSYPVSFRNGAVADKNYILERLGDPNVVIVDARTPAEYRGENRRAERAGHIPRAVNCDWVNEIDRTRNLRLKPAEELQRVLSK
ncbi:MAG TPA: rhodanese-like domain-containing protein, partial [Candidatus Methylomirabilis sp.]|nr:rhodanese-like domain-containing protein [Candidatus Methylomirabilis sp.]